ncbi:methyltransferase [Mycobacterium frederiksbergense]|uniref:Methyltransferase n=1 Tax=Mycolicibacterium frederiksbergense TaxID=117567 RepID=A0ABT6L533_9MYCO|nr:isoprenylcysteine carboxyl methyltransferase family protein [Mycolicibacterium frederiksbergense]MDH6198071.1 methyltransferase [Mycolicibacterium frederiksbergense]
MSANRFTALIAVIAAERVLELVVSQRNLRWSKAHGGKEFGAGHYPVMVALHSGLLLGSVLEARRRRSRPALGRLMFAVVLAAQGLRWWCIATLGRQWNTRVVVVPGARRVVNGPYRVVPHPNYVAVVTEGAALPLAGGAWITALVFSAANAALLRTRVRVENEALQGLT